MNLIKPKELKKLNNLRKSKGLNYSDMGSLLSISKTYYWQIENGKRRLSYNMACKIAKVFKLKPDRLFYHDFTSNNESIIEQKNIL